MLKGGDGGGCALKKEREMALDEIHQTVKSLLDDNTCNGAPYRSMEACSFYQHKINDNSYNCPTGLNLTSYSKRTCGRAHTNDRGCSSTTFSVGDLPYSQVCGRIKGYQFEATRAFSTSVQGIDSYYVCGVSLTHGGASSRQHIWTFANGLTEVTSNYRSELCPCDTYDYSHVSQFVGNDYFCVIGFHSYWCLDFELFPADA